MAISVSNPTSATGRVTAEKMLQGRFYFLRQDLSYLKSIAGAAGSRRALSASPAPDPNIRKSLIQERNELITLHLPVETVSEGDYPLLKHSDGTVPLCTLRVDGTPVRPDKVKCRRNAVALTRRFGSRVGHPPLSIEIDALLTQFTQEEVRETLLKVVYTPGRKDGFINRLSLITDSHCKSIHNVVGMHLSSQMAHLDRLLPVDLQKLPDWMGKTGDLLTLLQDVVITGRASAGAPYWRKKGDCIEQIFYMVELIASHVRAGTLDTLLQEQPELFLIECKNKTDRYEYSKLKDKTRPYFNPPAHWSLLASYLFQGLSKALFKVGCGTPTTNAYGWSAAKGGIDKLVEDVKRRFARGERGWCYVYGDDGDLYFVAGGVLYRVSPDVKQMDSCVDFDTIVLTFRYIQHVYRKAHGESRLWDMIIEALIALLQNPRILISGTQLYTKAPDGLMSGIVGTTVFDTVKASVSYTDLLESHAQNPSQLLDEKYVSRIMMEKYGLRVKEGTWAPERVSLDPIPAAFDAQGNLIDPEDSLYGAGKFLGIQYVRATGPNRAQWLPYLPDTDWTTCVVAPREEDQEAQSSATGRLRTQFDRIRGYLTTGGAFSPRIRRALEYWLDQIPSEIILMQPQGTEPPEGIILGLDDELEWEYPTPEFVPTWKWVFDIYADPDNRFNESPPSIFTDEVLGLVTAARLKKRKVNMKLVDGEVKFEPFVPKENLPIGVEMEVVTKHPPPNLSSHWKGPVPKRVEEYPPAVPMVGLPLDLAYEQTREQAVANALNNPPPPSFLNVGEPLLLLSEARSLIVDEPPANIPVVMRTTTGAVKTVHQATPGGALGPALTLDATLLFDVIHNHINKFVSIDVGLSMAEAAAKIINHHGYQTKFHGSNLKIKDGQKTKATVGLRGFKNELYVDELGNKKNRCVKADREYIVQEWEGESLKQIREAFALLITERNKTLGQPVLDLMQHQDWSVGAEPTVAPYSQVPGDTRPDPPPALLLPQCPATIPVEQVDGTLTMKPPVVEAPPLPPPPNEKVRPPPIQVLVDVAPPVPTAPKPMPRSIYPHEERMEERQGRRIYVLSSDTEASDEEIFENAILVPGSDEEDPVNNYIGFGEVDEVLKSVGALLSRESPLKPKPSERYTIENLKTLLKIVTSKHKKKDDKQKAKEEKPSNGAPPLPPRKAPPPKAETARPAETGNEGGDRRPNSNRGRRQRGPRKGHKGAGNGSSVFQRI